MRRKSRPGSSRARRAGLALRSFLRDRKPLFEQLEQRHLLAAIRMLPGFEANTLPRGDDVWVGPVGLPFEINFFGELQDQLFINTNGNVTFEGGFEEGVPFDAERFDIELEDLQRSIIAPFWADVDTTDSTTGTITYGTDAVNGRSAFGVNWVDVGFESMGATLTNSFQFVIINRSDILPGAFDLEFNYDSIEWETGFSSGGDDGFGGAVREPAIQVKVGYQEQV